MYSFILYLQWDRILGEAILQLFLSAIMLFSCFSLLYLPWECFEHPQGDYTKSVHLIELFILKLLFCSKLYSGSEYTNTVSLFGFIPLALVIHTCI